MRVDAGDRQKLSEKKKSDGKVRRRREELQTGLRRKKKKLIPFGRKRGFGHSLAGQ